MGATRRNVKSHGSHFELRGPRTRGADFFFIGSTRSSASAMLVLLIIVAVLIVGVLLGRMGDRTRDGEGMSPVAVSGVL
jgi:hypothetical protein